MSYLFEFTISFLYDATKLPLFVTIHSDNLYYHLTFDFVVEFFSLLGDQPL